MLKQIKKLLPKFKKILIDNYKIFGSVIWRFFNSPIILLAIALFVGNYYLPSIITNSQLKAQQILNEKAQKYQYGQTLLNSYVKVTYLAKNYYWNYKYEPDFNQRKEVLWEEYHNALRDWNIQLVANIIAIEKYTGSDNRKYFENEVQNNIVQINTELLHIRDTEPVDDNKINNLFLNVLDNRMYRIAYELSY